MTPQEHSFMLMLYAKQTAKFNVLFEVLKAKGLVQADDLLAYRSFTLEETPEQATDWLRKAWEAYQSIAASLGIATGLEDGPVAPS